MKIRDCIKCKLTEEKVADLRVKLLFLFIAGVVCAFIAWLLRKLCTVHVGLCWYTVLGIPYHLGRFVGVVAFLGLILAWAYLFLFSLWDNFSLRGSAVVFSKKPPGGSTEEDDEAEDEAEPGDADWSLNRGDLSDFD